MYEIFMPSLEHIVLVKLTTTLWNQADIKASIARVHDTYRDLWSPIEEQVTSKVLLFPLPQSLKERMLGLIKPIGKQISEWWQDYYRVTDRLAVNLPDEFYFTPRGALDRKKTNEALVKNEAIHIAERYQIACTYCLPEDVKALWERMPWNCRRLFYTKKHPRLVQQNELVVFWTYHIQGEVAKMGDMISWDNGERCTANQWALEIALRDDNKVAIEYFLNKLNPEEKEASITYAMSHSLQLVQCLDIDDIDTVCFMLSQMNEAQRLQLIEMRPQEVLAGFLQWPHQSLFRVMMSHVEVFLNDDDYYEVLHAIVEKVQDGYKDYDYEKLFAEFWLRGDATRKKYVLNECATSNKINLLLRLIWVKGTKMISLIIKDATDEEKENIVLNTGGYICSYLSSREDWDTTRYFLSEFVSSREGLVKLQDECKRGKWYISKKFLEWLDERIQKWNEKRRDEEKNYSSTKRFCGSLNKYVG